VDPAEPAIAIRGLTKFYGRFPAVRNLSFEVPRGEIFGFLGLNGAGKSTTIRVLLDLLRPTSGQALIFGIDCRAEGRRARRQTGYLPGEMGIYNDLTGHQALDFLTGLSEQPVQPQYRAELQRRLELPDSDLRRKLREYSTGMKRKLGLIQAMQADPPLLILDEPTEGLDPLMREAFNGLLGDLRARGRTVFLSSHVLPEVERICHRIALIRNGELALIEKVEEIRKLAPRSVRVIFRLDVKCPEQFPAGHNVVESAPREWKLRVIGPLGPLMELLGAYPVHDLQVDEPRLEDVLIKQYREGNS
jgi:ABC-2 type transport system ATP-binding protein